MAGYLRPSVSNGNAREQALIRRWWLEHHQGRGRIVWEYYLEGSYVDAIWFPEAPVHGDEQPGKDTARLFPIKGESIIVCEAKATLSTELIGQALVYSEFAKRAGSNLLETWVFAESGLSQMEEVARSYGLKVSVASMEERAADTTRQVAPPDRPAGGV